MFVYEKKLQYPVKIKNPNPKLAAVIIWQYGGPDGELGASLRYLSQRYSMPYAELKGLLTDIGTEELGHLEMVGTIVHQLTRNLSEEDIKTAGFDAYFVDHTTGVYPTAASGFPWSAGSISVSGDMIADLTEDLAAEQKARLTYDNILRLSDDPDVNDAIKFLRAREIVHFQRFGEAKRTRGRVRMPSLAVAVTIWVLMTDRVNKEHGQTDVNGAGQRQQHAADDAEHARRSALCRYLQASAIPVSAAISSTTANQRGISIPPLHRTEGVDHVREPRQFTGKALPQGVRCLTTPCRQDRKAVSAVGGDIQPPIAAERNGKLAEGTVRQAEDPLHAALVQKSQCPLLVIAAEIEALVEVPHTPF